MRNIPPTNQTESNQQFSKGAPVYDVDGNHVGDVSEHGVQQGCLVVHHGLMRQDVYVPLHDIQPTTGNEVYLTLNKTQFESIQANQPPSGGSWSNLGDRDLDTGLPANTPVGANPTFPDGNNVAGTRQGPGLMSRTGGSGSAASALGNLGPTPTHGDDVSIPVREEELVANKRREQAGAGQVRVHKDVVEQPETISAPVTHEELRVERMPVQGGVPAGQDAFQERDINIPLMGEKLSVEKQGRVAEELHLHKERVTEQEQAQGTVRRERVNIEGAQPLDEASPQQPEP